MKPGIDYIGISVSFYCHNVDNYFLLHKRSQKCRDEKGTWDFGGGKVEMGERLEETVMREMIEEYGVSGIIEKQLPAHSLLRVNEGKKTHWLIISFITKVDKTKIINNDPDKIVEIGWFRLNNLPQPLHSGAKFTLEKYKDEFKKYR